MANAKSAASATPASKSATPATTAAPVSALHASITPHELHDPGFAEGSLAREEAAGVLSGMMEDGSVFEDGSEGAEGDTSDADDEDDASNSDDSGGVDGTLDALEELLGTEEGDEGSDEEGESEEEGPEPLQPEDLDLDAEVVVKVNGEDVTVKLSEALAGYSRQTDYSRKTAEVATARKEVEAAANAIRAEAVQYGQKLQIIERALVDAGAGPDIMMKLNAEQTRLNTAMQQDNDVQMEQATAREQQLLATSAPDIDAARMTELHDFAAGLGYSKEELSMVVDHRIILLLDKAARFDGLTEAGTNAIRTKRSKKGTKTLKPGTRARKAKGSKKISGIRAKLNPTGGISRDAATDAIAGAFFND